MNGITIRFLVGLLSVLVVATAAAAQQPRLIFTNSWTNGGPVGDGILMLEGQDLRPLAQSDPGVTGTRRSIDRPLHVVLAGQDWLYWWDGYDDRLYRGTDVNGNGVIDIAEMQHIWDNSVYIGGAIATMSSLTLREQNGRILIANKAGGGTPSALGAVLLTDVNGDGDFFDAGETQEVINGGAGQSGSGSTYGSTIVVDGYPVSTDRVEAADFMPDGDVIFYDDRDHVWVRKDLTTGVATLFLNYGQAQGQAANLPVQPQFADATLPAPSSFEDVDKVVVESASRVWLACSYETTSPWIFECKDLDADGSVNGAGEVTLWWDGSNAPAAAAILSMDRWGATMYVAARTSHSLSGAVSLYELHDVNGDGDASDAGELTVLMSWPAGASPRIEGLSAMSPTAFGSSCVGFTITDDEIGVSAGTLSFTVDDVPASIQGPSTLGLVMFSFAGDSYTEIFPGCGIGLTPDPLTALAIDNAGPYFLFGPVTGPTYTTLPAPYGFGIPYSVPVIHYAAILVDVAGPEILASPSKLTNDSSIL